MPKADTLMLNIIDRRSVYFAVSISSIQIYSEHPGPKRYNLYHSEFEGAPEWPSKLVTTFGTMGN